MSEKVNHPSHYNVGKIEVIVAIQDWKLGFNLGNVVKYVARAGKKDPKTLIEDLKKAAWYLNNEIEALESETQREKWRKAKKKAKPSLKKKKPAVASTSSAGSNQGEA